VHRAKGSRKTIDLRDGGRSVDTDRPADEAWILSVQRKLYQWGKANPDDAWRDMWGWMTDLRTLRSAWRRVASNKGKRSAGVDGMTVGRIRLKVGEQRFLEGLQEELRSGAYRPSPSRRKLIPKAGKPGQFRPLGIPTVKDRVVQGAIKLLLEPIFEAQFWNVSYGFRPGRSVHGALERIRLAIQPRKRDQDGHRRRLPYPWIIEGDIKGCFDNLSHHHLLWRLRQRIADRRMTRLVGRFLKAGVLAEDQFLRTNSGSPQGGIVSPLLSNIALSAIEERYERWVYHRTKIQERRQSDGAVAAAKARGRDHAAGRCVFLPVRYADDFVVLVSGSQEDALAEKSALAEYLRRTTGLELSPEKTKVTAMTEGFEFLGFHVVMRWDKRYGYGPRVEIPKAKAADLRWRIKQLTKCNTTQSVVVKSSRRSTSSCADGPTTSATVPMPAACSPALTGTSATAYGAGCGRNAQKATARDILGAFQPSRRRPKARLWRDGQSEQHMLAWTPSAGSVTLG
jgi:RNA-directed DNA polymerase